MVTTSPSRHRIDTSWGSVVAVDEGAGPAVLLVHGYCGTHEDWADVSPLLVGGGRRVVRIDLPGHGESSLRRPVMTGIDIAGVIDAVLGALDLRGAVLAGHSLGGIGALRYAVDHGEGASERLDGLVLVGTSATPLRPAEVSTVAMGSHPLARPALAVPVIGRAALRATCFAPHAGTERVDQVRRVWRDTPFRTRWAYAGGAGTEAALWMKLHRVAVPTVAVTGTADTRTPPSRALQLRRGIPGARVELVERAGHAILVERPDAVAHAILTVDRTPAGVS